MEIIILLTQIYKMRHRVSKLNYRSYLVYIVERLKFRGIKDEFRSCQPLFIL